MSYGYFDDANREYVITNPRTPVKWINYVGTLAFGGFVDHTGGALICKGDPALNRITRYIPQLPSADFKGSTVYLRFKAGDIYKVFSPYFVPTLDRYDSYECHVGMGYTRIISVFYGIRTEALLFVPQGGDRLIQDVRVTNVSKGPLEIDAIPVVEYTHFDALKQFNNADWVPQTMQSALVMDGEAKILTQYAFMRKDTAVNYFTSSGQVTSFESDRKHFLGDNEYGSWANPLGLQEPELGNYEARRGDNIGALLHHLGVLQPGEGRRLVTQLGQAASIAAELPQIRRYRDESTVDEAFAALQAYWCDYLSIIQVETPDPSLNSMLNVFNPRQCHTTKNWSRYLSLYQLGLGTRGIGFRDSSQDVMGVVAHMPGEAKALLSMLLGIQTRAGYAMHQMNPLTGTGDMEEPRAVPERPQYYSDDHLWAVLAVCAYLKETGDYAYLKKKIPFYDRKPDGRPAESGSVLEHLKRAVAFTRDDLGAHGLPLAGFADWNDTINFMAGAESLFTASLYGKALLELIGLMEHLGDKKAVRDYTADYEAMKARVNEHAWDGAWYIRYFDPAGEPVGSHLNQTGQIYTNSQSWPVLSDFAPPERARVALEMVAELLNTANGIKLSRPGYNGFDPVIGGFSTYPPGAKENGGIFLHANPWVIIAETVMGNGDRAYRYYSQINPATRNERIDEYECEPYVYAQNMLGDEHPQFGLGRNSWLSGTASWMYQAGTQYILGVQPTYEGLRIAPCIPKAWDGFTVTRRYRGAIYHITVRNPRHVSQGVVGVAVDGKPIDCDMLPLFKKGEHTVTVVMG